MHLACAQNPSATPEQAQKLANFWRNVDHTDEDHLLENILVVKTQMAGMIPLIFQSILLIYWMTRSAQGDGTPLDQHWYVPAGFVVWGATSLLFAARAKAKSTALRNARR